MSECINENSGLFKVSTQTPKPVAMKKYLAYLLLPLLIVCFYVFKTQPRKDAADLNAGLTVKRSNSVDQRGAFTEAMPNSTGDNGERFDRSATRIIYSKHARCRMDCRYITDDEVKEILQHGKVNTLKIETDSRGTTYPLEGMAQGHHLRIVFAPKNDAVEVVTCIDLDKEWPCHCN